MKPIIKLFGACAIMLLASCATKNAYLEVFTPEESGLNLVKLTEESASNVIAGQFFSGQNFVSKRTTYKNQACVYCVDAKCGWYPFRSLTISPDGSKLAYLYRANGQDNIMVRSSGAHGAATQRTFRNVRDFCWSKDNKLYFSDRNGNNSYISAVDASQGSMMSQLTSGSVNDLNPASIDGSKVYFTRESSTGPFIWSLDRSNGTLTSCAPGYNVCLIPNDPEAFYCVRNSSFGRSEIWYINYVRGQETLLLTDEKRSFANPTLSPDGQWLAIEGNSKSSISDKENIDIFVVKTDGTRLTQLTFNPSHDACPVWAKDGRSIYFISSRANKNEAFNIWRMNFNMD